MLIRRTLVVKEGGGANGIRKMSQGLSENCILGHEQVMKSRVAVQLVMCLPSMYQSSAPKKLDMVTQAWNLNTGEAEAAELGVHGNVQLHEIRSL